jgi:hypothetical protein
VTPKQKTAIVALVVSAIVAVSAMFAPNIKCQPDPQLIEDALGGDSSTSGPGPDLATFPPDLGAPSDSSGGSSS